MRVLIVAALLLAVVAAADKKETPYIMVTKSVSETDVIVSKPVTVTVSAINIGQGAAFDVSIVDSHPLGSESQTKSAPKLEQGENITLTYVFIPTELGTLHVRPATVTYLTAEGETNTESALSNFINENEELYRGEMDESTSVRGLVAVMTQDKYDALHASKILEIIVYGIFCAIVVVFPYYLYKAKQSQVETLLREAKKK